MPTAIRSPLLPPVVFEVKEQTTGHYTALITDDDGAPIPATSLTSLTLTLYAITQDGSTGIINSRDTQDVLNANNVTVDADGNLVWAVQVGDTTLLELIPFERHIALFSWTTATITGRHEFVLNIQNLRQVS